MDVFFPHVTEENVEVARLIPQERSQQSTVEEIVDFLVPQIQERSPEVIKVIVQEHECQCVSWNRLWIYQFHQSRRRSLRDARLVPPVQQVVRGDP